MATGTDASQPEPYSNAWYRQQLGGLNVRANRSDAEWKSQHDLIAALTKKVEALELERDGMKAKIGELNGRLEELETWMREMERIRQERSKQKAGAA